jgi:aspartyl-tRNA(Asn)/glutamyl-tRNA(Gln) amidotransferase subunit B
MAQPKARALASWKPTPDTFMTWKTDIGLEVHVQLRTQSKMFCGCANASGGEPNTQVCPVCLGYPGALPVVNEEAVKLTVRTGLLLGCDIQPFSKFDRKNYFYPDQAKNYQISQYDQPLCLGGGLEIEVGGTRKFIRLTRIHLEEDVAKNTHFDEASGIDFNRGGTPLMEIVTEPDLSTPDETMAFLLALKQVLHYGEVSDCNLEQGNIRCDVNSSVRPEGQAKLGVKVELKNMNTFKGVHRALKSELARQVRELERGGTLVQETRRWNDEAGVTESMRTTRTTTDIFPSPICCRSAWRRPPSSGGGANCRNCRRGDGFGWSSSSGYRTMMQASWWRTSEWRITLKPRRGCAGMPRRPRTGS